MKVFSVKHDDDAIKRKRVYVKNANTIRSLCLSSATLFDLLKKKMLYLNNI